MTPKRVIGILHTEIRGLHEAAYLLAFFTLGSQVFALVRDRLLAHTFGAGETLDVFYAAFRVPDTLYALLASLVSLFVLIPFIEAAQKRGKESLHDFLSNMFTFFSGSLVLLSVVVWFFVPSIVVTLYKDFTPEMHVQLVTMVRILLFQPLLLGVSNLFAAYVQVRGRFLLYAVAPILYNVGIILGILFLYPMFGEAGLACGVVLGAILHLGIQTPFVVSSGMLPRLQKPNWSEVYDVIRISIPRTVTLSTQQIVVLVMVSLASRYASGSVTSFSFAWNLQAVPLAIIGVSYSVAAFPKLAHLYTQKEFGEYKDLVLVAMRQILFWALPTTVLFVVFRAHIVRLILGSGQFDWAETRMTAAVLAIFVISLVGQGCMVLLVRACYAAGKTMAPLLINVTSMLVTVLLAFVLLHYASIGAINLTALGALMRVEGVLSTEVLLIAVAYSVGAIINTLILLWYFERVYAPFVSGVWTTFWHSLIASLFSGYASYITLSLVSNIISISTFTGLLIQAFVAGIAGICVWATVLVVFSDKALEAAWMALRARLTRRRVEEARGPIEGS